MTVAHIRFATDIIRRLGEELNPSPDQRIVELVKNAYDADARTCSVELINTDQPGGSVRVKDDGDGLDSQGIVNGWLVVGRSIKTRRERTRLGRIPAGSKGLGRLAALRMGDFAKLTSWPRWEESAEYLLKIDWRDFEDVHLVDEVELNISRSSRQAGAHQGTEILLEKLRSGISRVDVSRLARALVLLADPFEDNPIGFRPTLAAPEYADLEALVRNRNFQEADYHLATALDERGHATAVVKDWKGKELFEGSHKELTAGRDNRPYECPEASFDLWAFILNKAAFSARSVSLSAVREWLKVFGGVHLYHNGLRVSPYGNPGNDWLDLNLQRVKSPEERPSTNTSIGRIAVTDTSEQLIQKTDRSGFIEDHAFAELRSLAQDALDWMARRRLDAALRRRATEKASGRRTSDRSKKSLQRAIEGAPKA